jgi:tRNA pseudouridine13 synthase
MMRESLPCLTAELPGIGGVIKHIPEDFVVEEIPAYQPSGSGEHLFLWVEKRDISAEQLTQHLARALDVPRNEIGMAGLKDRRAVTRQLVSVPARRESRVTEVETDNIRVLSAARHGNKLKTAHLKGNRFSILLRETAPEAQSKAQRIAERIAAIGFPNYFGDQRFGHQGDTLSLGLALLRGERTEQDLPKARRKFLKRLSLSAVQSDLFNQALADRLNEQLVDRVLWGDVMQVVASGGVFVAEDPAVEEQRFLAGEIVSTGPLFGPKMREPAGDVVSREASILSRAELSREHFRKFAKLTPGARRPYLVRPVDFSIREEPEGLRLEVTLPAGVYATMLLREFQKAEPGL